MKLRKPEKTATVFRTDLKKENDMNSEKEKRSFDISAFMGGAAGKAVCVIAALLAAFSIGFAGYDSYGIISEENEKDAINIEEDGEYYSKDEVAAYIHKYDHLPGNYITKKEAEQLGWIGGSVEAVAPGKSIGGDRFYAEYDKSGDLATAEGRYYTECDVDTKGAKDRGKERLVFSNDGLIYYTNDHYNSFELTYGEDILKEFD